MRLPINADHYHGGHYLGSRRHTLGERPDVIQIGEYTGKETWDDAIGPSAQLQTAIVGDPEDMLRLASKRGDIFDEWKNGFPRACYSSEPCTNFILQTSPQEYTSWRFYAKLVDLVYNHILDVEAYLIAQVPGYLSSSIYPTADPAIAPSFAACKALCGEIIALEGTTNSLQACSQILYAANGPVDMGQFSTNPFWYSIAEDIFFALIADGYLTSNRYYIGGHSYGAAITRILANLIADAQPDADIRLITFACPRIGDARAYSFVPPEKCTDIVNFGDPIPAVPPGETFGMFWEPFVATLFRAFWHAFDGPPTVNVLHADGTFESGSVIPYEETLIRTLATTIEAGTPLAAATEHYLDTYRERLALLPFCPDRP